MATLYQRSGFWWMRGQKDGQEYRRSTKTKDLDRAHEIVREFERALQSTSGNPDWQKVVEGWREDSQSWLHRKYRNMRDRSAMKGWPEYMSLVELEALTLRSDGRCAITGLPFELSDQTVSRRNPFGISLDRIDCSRGYVVGNSRCVCLIVNIAMSNWGSDSVRIMARALVGAEMFQCLGQTTAHVNVIETIEKRLNTTK